MLTKREIWTHGNNFFNKIFEKSLNNQKNVSPIDQNMTVKSPRTPKIIDRPIFKKPSEITTRLKSNIMRARQTYNFLSPINLKIRKTRILSEDDHYEAFHDPTIYNLKDNEMVEESSDNGSSDSQVKLKPTTTVRKSKVVKYENKILSNHKINQKNTKVKFSSTNTGWRPNF